jgi:ribosome-associated toxin RatA of RatAB toxin-antitoxin module
MKRVARSALVECSAQTFYELVEDVESYPKFLPWCVAATVGERSEGRTVATLTVGAKGLRQSFTTENRNLPGRSIEMRLVEGPFKHLAGAWRFTPLTSEATKVEFSLEYEFSSRVIAAALGPIFAHIADSTVEAFTRRAIALRNA